MHSRILLVLIFSMLVNCAHPYLSRWDSNDFTICCKNEPCNIEDLTKEAHVYCDGKTIITAGLKSEKATDEKVVPKHPGDPTTKLVGTETTCLTYQCLGQFNPKGY